MRKMLVCALVLALLPGCKKAMDKLSEDTQVKPTENAKTLNQVLTHQKGPGVHAPTGVVISQGSGGSGGAAQAVRTAVVRTVNMSDLHNIRLFMENASAVTGQIPTKQEIEQALMREARKTYELVKENVIILTGTRTRESIWAYTYEPQSADGQHLVIRSGNVERMPAQDLRQALTQQGVR